MTGSLAAVPSVRELRTMLGVIGIVLAGEIGKRYEILHDEGGGYESFRGGSGEGGTDPEADLVGELVIVGFRREEDPDHPGEKVPTHGMDRVGARKALEDAARYVRRAETAMIQARLALIAVESVSRQEQAAGTSGTRAGSQEWTEGAAVKACDDWEAGTPGAKARAAKAERARLARQRAERGGR